MRRTDTTTNTSFDLPRTLGQYERLRQNSVHLRIPGRIVDSSANRARPRDEVCHKWIRFSVDLNGQRNGAQFSANPPLQPTEAIARLVLIEGSCTTYWGYPGRLSAAEP